VPRIVAVLAATAVVGVLAGPLALAVPVLALLTWRLPVLLPWLAAACVATSVTVVATEPGSSPFSGRGAFHWAVQTAGVLAVGIAVLSLAHLAKRTRTTPTGDDGPHDRPHDGPNDGRDGRGGGPAGGRDGEPGPGPGGLAGRLPADLSRPSADPAAPSRTASTGPLFTAGDTGPYHLTRPPRGGPAGPPGPAVRRAR
jgi:arabinofuranan 3-O-arabinosyltransferase